MENYGAHDWDGEGECPQYWKAKGGYVYVVEHLNWLDVDANKELAETVCKLISNSDEYSSEYVIDWSFEEDAEPVTQEWEIPIRLFFNGDNWVRHEIRAPYAYTKAYTEQNCFWDLDANGNTVEGSYRTLYYFKGEARSEAEVKAIWEAEQAEVA